MIISVKEVRNFLISILIPLVIGYASSFISQMLSGVDIATSYSQLIKPGFAPPSFIFPIAWTIIYILMGISSYIIMKKDYKSTKVKDAMFYYWLQLGLNFLWSILFFGLDLRFTAMADLIIMIIILIIMIFKFRKLDKKVAYLNIPYLLWIFYALFLNYFIWTINR
ncbi:TspO/MBR family protein [[Clostridium] dakarense]|uniref:TspO/MBR family protein n=1 Tax=Faecalimicrobium dakarense TaxID=1301100 RepID=UPI0004B69DEA|nr:TspO/MBR family protein [[Clostridium] dakarense]